MRVADPPSFVGCIPILLGSIALTIGVRCPCAIAGSETARPASRPTTNLTLEVAQILFDIAQPFDSTLPEIIALLRFAARILYIGSSLRLSRSRGVSKGNCA